MSSSLTAPRPVPTAPGAPALPVGRTSGLLRQSVAGLRVLLALTAVCGVLYPALMLGVGALMPGRAGGSMVSADGRVVGSSLLGQLSPGARYFQPRPSVAGKGYDPRASGASNLGPSNADLARTVRQRRAAVAASDGVSPGDVPADAVTASGSGLDPDISPAYAAIQVSRVARANGLPAAAVRRLVADHTAGRTLGFIGEERVDVLELNIAVMQAAHR